MAIEKWLAAVGLLCCAVTVLYILFFLPQVPIDDSRLKDRPTAERFLRKERAAENKDCLWVLIARESLKTLTSPNYPDPYPSHAYCQWLLTTLEPNASISIQIETLAVEPEEECRLDYLQIFLGSNERAPSLGPFCGNVNNRIIDTNSSTLLLVFHSDSAYEDKGFSIDYYTPVADGCKELVTEASDTVTSPGYPDNYPGDTDCWTVITVGENEKIVLNFESMDLEHGENCTFDYVQIFDGKDQNSEVLGQICQQSDTLSFESSSNSLLVHFHSDGTVNKRGYRARYTSVDKRSKLLGNCFWESVKNKGTVTSPNYPENYPSFANCSVWIVAPEGSKILITLDTILLEMDSNCSYDFLRITEGSTLLALYCGRRSEVKSLMSNRNQIKLEFQSDSFVEFQGFKLHYEFIQTDTEKEEDDPFAFEVEPQNATLAAGATYMLRCGTERPNSRIRWLKGDVFLSGETPLPGLELLENNTLWIRNMQTHLTGQYTCVAVSSGGDIVTTAHLQMEDHCGIEFRKTPFDSELKEGDFAHLECLATLPEVQLSWEKEGQPLRHQQHITILKNGYIFMDKVTMEDAGLYTCVARDTESGCIRRVSATLKISEKTKIEDICGKPKFEQRVEETPRSDHAKIVGGRNAPKGAYPWQVMLWERERKSFCGATLLNERWIATAAHCIVNNKHAIPWDKITVKLGKYDTQKKEEQEMSTSIADSSAILIHPGFNKMTYDNDLALIRLRHRVYFTDYILPICLPDRNLSETLMNGALKMGVVIGWGELTEKGSLPRFLQEIKLPIMDYEICRNSTNYSVTRNMFCAGYSQEVIGDSCHGDSGGPFMMKHQGRWHLLGIVSWGEGCGKSNKYGFYTRIPNHLPWIQGIIKS